MSNASTPTEDPQPGPAADRGGYPFPPSLTGEQLAEIRKAPQGAPSPAPAGEPTRAYRMRELAEDLLRKAIRIAEEPSPKWYKNSDEKIAAIKALKARLEKRLRSESMCCPSQFINGQIDALEQVEDLLGEAPPKASEAEQFPNAFEGAGRPMTWTRAKPDCELCKGTGWYGDRGPGRKGNSEYQPCECTQRPPDEAKAESGERSEPAPTSSPTPASGDTAPTETQKELEQFRKESPIFDALMIELRGSWPQYEHYARLLNEARGFRAPIREAKAPADEDPTEGGKYVYCHGCSEAGGAGRAIYHLPPACGEAKADPGQGTGEG